jgi:PAS domain S-box-containing protein
MKKNQSPSAAAAASRPRAEEHPKAKAPERRAPLTADETRRLLHELQVHQIEMEVQNAELLRTREEFELSRNKYAELYELAPVGFFTFDLQGVIRELNLTGARLLGTVRRELLNKTFSSFIADAQGRKLFMAHLQSVLQGQGAQTCELNLTVKNGTVMCGQLQSISVDAADSKDSYLLCSLVDGTAAKQLESEIQHAREYAENIVETVRAPLVVLDCDLKILTANQSFYQTFKTTPGDTIGHFIYALGDGQWDIPRLRVLFEEILPQETVFYDYEVEHDFPRIGRKIILLNARQIFRGKIGSHIILLGMEDITERRSAEDILNEKNREIEELNGTLEIRIGKAVDELRQKDKMLILHDRLGIMGEMIDNMARQWSEPLNSLELIAQQVPLYYDSGEFREFFKENAAKAMGLIQDMSKTVKGLRNSFQPDKKTVPFSVNQLITRTVHLVEKSFKEQKIRIDLQPEGDPMANGYPNEYSQVLLNILMNARDALVAHDADDALISIHSFAEGSRSVVTISDNAGGIPEEIMDHIFDPYFTTKGPDKGTGIGLFMSKAIIEKNLGGRLTACNAGPGALFRIEV